jgi:hypothetical protein
MPPMIATLMHELRQLLRALAARLGFSALVVGVLASGIAGVIFMLVMVNGFVLRSLPFLQPEQLHTGWQLAIGLIVGVVLGRLLAGALTGVLHSIEASDPMVALTVLAMLILVAVVAILVPARPVLRVHLTEALRYE